MYSGIRYLLLKPVTACQVLRPDIRQQTSEVGFPIRKSADQSLFAAPHGLSQRITSFIACACQGIHRTPLLHLIALIIDARLPRNLAVRERSKRHSRRPALSNENGPAHTAKNRGMSSDRPSSRWDGLERPVSHENCPSARRSSFASFRSSRGPKPRNVRTTLLFTMSANRQQRPQGRAANPIFNDKRSGGSQPRRTWWSQTGSNRRPHACKARALPTELWPQMGRVANSP
jgi:hypothetical protein